MSNNNREFERIRVNHTAMVRVHGTNALLGSGVVDLSGGGMRLKVPERVEDNAALAITMTSADTGQRIVACGPSD